ncbi:hypothetical protein [Thalassotalea sp. PS06]|uniref:hypothetical protein n=1 Tax=Thalassotalea sp. PS06 TaxID=2594005 RepID=UPI001162AE2D|nr:hypothetical protein [Thalassotalea sp. PS06]QDP01515.1 hypothetical protein FNC98_09315 [Thalassotalea sp. PS06]
MKVIIKLLVCFWFIPAVASAGDMASGDTRYSTDFSNEFKKHQLTKADKDWVESLINAFSYSGKVVHFVRTDLILYKRGEAVAGRIYQSLEYPDLYYIAEGDVLFDLNQGTMTSPGTGGFSMHSPSSKDFIVSLNFQKGVPFSYFSHFNIGYNKVWWWADEVTRI